MFTGGYTVHRHVLVLEFEKCLLFCMLKKLNYNNKKMYPSNMYTAVHETKRVDFIKESEIIWINGFVMEPWGHCVMMAENVLLE